MNSIQSARLRRSWPVFCALAVCAAFLLVHVLVYQPMVARYRHALDQAGNLGLMLDPAHPSGPTPVSPRVFSLLMDNSLTARDVDAKSQSGALAAEMVQTLSTLASQHGLEVIVAEPGLLTQQTGAVEVRAHLRLHGEYAGFVAMLDQLARSGRLWSIERFGISAPASGHHDFEVWFSSCLLKRAGGAA